MVYKNDIKEKKHFIHAVLAQEKQRNETMRLAYEKGMLKDTVYCDKVLSFFWLQCIIKM